MTHMIFGGMEFSLAKKVKDAAAVFAVPKSAASAADVDQSASRRVMRWREDGAREGMDATGGNIIGGIFARQKKKSARRDDEFYGSMQANTIYTDRCFRSQFLTAGDTVRSFMFRSLQYSVANHFCNRLSPLLLLHALQHRTTFGPRCFGLLSIC